MTVTTPHVSRIIQMSKWNFIPFIFQMQIGLPITGKYRDPESDQYYNHNDVSENAFLDDVLATLRINFDKNMVSDR